MRTLLCKLSSRKFWVAVLGAASAAIGAASSDNPTVELVLAVSGTLITLLWLMVEGKCDLASIQAAAASASAAIYEYEKKTGDEGNGN